MCLYISRGCNLLPRGRSLASSLSFILRNVLQAKSQPNTLATKQVALEAKEHARAKDFVSDWWMLFSGAGRSGADAALDQFFSHCWENDEGEDDPHLHHAATELTLWCALCQTFVMIETLLLFLQDCSLRCFGNHSYSAGCRHTRHQRRARGRAARGAGVLTFVKQIHTYTSIKTKVPISFFLRWTRPRHRSLPLYAEECLTLQIIILTTIGLPPWSYTQLSSIQRRPAQKAIVK